MYTNRLTYIYLERGIQWRGDTLAADADLLYLNVTSSLCVCVCIYIYIHISG